MANTSIHNIDLNWMGNPESIGVHVLRGSNGIAIVDPGPHRCNETLIAGLAELGITPADVRHVVLTHIHLDHAGGAWWWAANGGVEGDRATIHVHAEGALHMIDPSRLNASAGRIYGDEMLPMWGAINPIDGDRVRSVGDGDVIDLGGIALTTVETLGHAKHHNAYVFEHAGERLCLTGDAAAMNVPGYDYVSLPAPPPEFDLQVWLDSLDRLRALECDALLPTHFGRIDHVQPWLDAVGETIKNHVRFFEQAVANAGGGKVDVEAMRSQYRQWLIGVATSHGLDDTLARRHVSNSLVHMNVTGILRWIESRAVKV